MSILGLMQLKLIQTRRTCTVRVCGLVTPEKGVDLRSSPASLSISGTFINFATFITIVANGTTFGQQFRILIKHQSLIDGFAGFVTAILLLQTNPRWTTGETKPLTFFCLSSRRMFIRKNATEFVESSFLRGFLTLSWRTSDNRTEDPTLFG